MLISENNSAPRASTLDYLSLPPIDPLRGYEISVARLYLGNVSGPTIYRLIRAGKLASYTIGKRRFVRGSEIARFTAGEPPEKVGDPINEKMAARMRIAGRAGGSSKAARAVARRMEAPAA